jgi:hypothetical protein
LKSGDENSFLFDNQFLLSITVNGQLLLAMLTDKLITIPFIKMLQHNTDGISIMYNKQYTEDIMKICKDWEELTNLTLEYAYYSKMIINNVNNYLAVYTNNKVKNKGLFEIEKEYHKDNSFKIVPIALQEFFVNNIDIETTVKNHTNIYDFCGRVKSKHDSWYMMNNEKQQKNVRYYVSKDGGKLLKKYKDGRTAEVHVDYRSTVANKIYDDKDYDDINYTFYVKECYKIVDTILPKQLNLF